MFKVQDKRSSYKKICITKTLGAPFKFNPDATKSFIYLRFLPQYPLSLLSICCLSFHVCFFWTSHTILMCYRSNIPMQKRS